MVGESHMLDTKNRFINKHNFGELELVDKEIYYIAFNRRDN